tara:strand:- start:615 stop:1019 length:405 start_codon:yes stop_codon:yes gene_type:complete
MITFQFATQKKNEAVDITSLVLEIVRKNDVVEGICQVFTPHATAAIILNESADPNIGEDLHKALRQAIPDHNDYLHDKIDNNAAAHIKASLFGPSESIPVHEGRLVLGTWQAIMLVELDGPKNRKVIVNIVGER